MLTVKYVISPPFHFSVPKHSNQAHVYLANKSIEFRLYVSDSFWNEYDFALGESNLNKQFLLELNLIFVSSPSCTNKSGAATYIAALPEVVSRSIGTVNLQFLNPSQCRCKN